jgi:hypothetical protein
MCASIPNACLFSADAYSKGNLIYLGLLTDRVPVVGRFMPSHIEGNAQPIPFGEVFDLPRLRRALGRPIVEWDDVKDIDSPEYDVLGCWNLWAVVMPGVDSHPRESASPEYIKLGTFPSRLPFFPQGVELPCEKIYHIPRHQVGSRCIQKTKPTNT